MDLSALKIHEVMTPLPVTIDEDADLPTARKLLRDRNIRHLPVVHGGKLSGLLSERDTRLVALVPDLSKVAVADVMVTHPLTVSEDTPVSEAVAQMVAKKYGCLIVTGPNGSIAGIFTSHDALRLLIRERERDIPTPPGPRTPGLDDEDWGDADDCID